MNPTPALLIGLVLGAVMGWCANRWRTKRLERMRARFLSFLAHEINAPVASLNMTALNFVHGVFGPTPKEHLTWLVLMREQAARLNALVGDLRDFIHSEFHRDLRLRKERVALGRMIPACLEGMRESLARSGATVDMHLGTLPEVAADPDRLLRVWTAVFNHARKFRTQGPILVSTEASPIGVSVTVEYMGLKISPEQQHRALDLFYPVRYPQTQVLASVGLGLGLARHIVEIHGGSMTLHVDEQGTCRIVTRLPQYAEALRQGHEKQRQSSHR